MSFLDIMKLRYTTKEYDHSKKLDQSKIEELKEILRLCPSSINSQPWKFIFVQDEKMKNEIAKASFFNDQKVLNCDSVVVFTSIVNITEFEKEISERLPEGAMGYYNKFIKPLSEHQIKSWMEKQVYLALGVFLSACADMNIDATPMEGIDTEKYNTILNLSGYTTLVAVAIGFRDTEDSNQPHITPKRRKDINQVIQSI